MIEWKFILNPDTDALEIDEPVRWSDFENSLERDDKIHGMRFEASISTLQFFGIAADFLRDKKELEGLKANVIFQALIKCNEEEEFEEVLKGRLNFGRYKEDCGETCFVTMPVEEDTCAVIFKNRYDQKVDIDNPKAFDSITNLNNYAGLRFPIDLPAKELLIQAQATVLPENDVVNYPSLWVDDGALAIRPSYGNVIYDSINIAQLDAPESNIQYDINKGGPAMSPQLLFEENLNCLPSDQMPYNVRLKGHLSMTGKSPGEDKYFASWSLMFVEYKVGDGPQPELGSAAYPGLLGPGGDINLIEWENHIIGDWVKVIEEDFDVTWTGTITPKVGYGYYAFVNVEVSVDLKAYEDFEFTLTFHPETSFDMQAPKACPSVIDADGYLIHETLSRATEAITNNCMRVKSSYYGRTDSQPFSFPGDGCGSLRMLTSGLKLRAAPEDKFFTSVKELIEGLTAIDNIGFAVEEDTTLPGKYILRVEAVEYFYQPLEMLRFDGIAKATRDVEEGKHYAKIEVGYNNWKVERVNGLDEFNSEREYRTSLDSVATVLNIRSNLVTGSYPYEITRQQSFAVTGGADTKYDNETFLICLIRDAYAYQVEQGGIAAPQNIYSPATVINFRLSPVRNLMRWFGSIIASYANYTDTANKLFFSSGTGNLTMEGEQASLWCKIEKQVIKENQHLSTAQFLSDDYLPIWKNELISFDYPLSTGQYKTIKANPYGYISFQCGQGAFEKGFIKELKYKPASGMASFVLRKKYF